MLYAIFMMWSTLSTLYAIFTMWSTLSNAHPKCWAKSYFIFLSPTRCRYPGCFFLNERFFQTRNPKKALFFGLQKFQTKDMRLQKKSYRVLEEICSSSSKAAEEFVLAKMSKIQEILLKSLTTASSISKAVRYRCWDDIVWCCGSVVLMHSNSVSILC